MKLEFSNVTKHFKNKMVLNNASFVINDNEIVSVIGPSGIGKSTVARIICKTISKESGSITIDGNEEWDKELIQLIPQQPFSSLDPRQTVIDSVTEPLLFHKLCINRKEAYLRAKSILNEMLISDELFERRPHELSGGQAQRVLIARSLTVEPELLIADEATSMLDTESQNEIINIFEKLVHEKNKSILFISHDLELVKSISNRIYFLENGVLKEL